MVHRQRLPTARAPRRTRKATHRVFWSCAGLYPARVRGIIGASKGESSMKAPGARVLIADDVRDSADTVALLLAEKGYDARAVYDGNAVVELAEKRQPRCALLGLSLPGMAGFDLAGRL